MVALILLTALGCALIAGVFFAFSTFVMKALSRLPAAHGVEAMQSINVVVLNRWFLGAFVGTGVGCLVLLAVSVVHWSDPASKLAVAGALSYLVGTFWVTRRFNIPRNDFLATIVPESAGAARAFQTFVNGWTKWNHVRTLFAAVAAALLMIALLVR